MNNPEQSSKAFILSLYRMCSVQCWHRLGLQYSLYVYTQVCVWKYFKILLRLGKNKLHFLDLLDYLQMINWDGLLHKRRIYSESFSLLRVIHAGSSSSQWQIWSYFSMYLECSITNFLPPADEYNSWRQLCSVRLCTVRLKHPSKARRKTHLGKFNFTNINRKKNGPCFCLTSYFSVGKFSKC